MNHVHVHTRIVMILNEKAESILILQEFCSLFVVVVVVEFEGLIFVNDGL